MKRRRILQALTVTPALAAQELRIGSAEAVAQPKRVFFTDSELATLQRLAAAVVPATDGKPGARECGAVEFLDFLLSRSPAALQRLYREGLARPLDLGELERGWRYGDTSFAARVKDDLLRATFNSREWIEASGRRGGGANYYWKPFA